MSRKINLLSIRSVWRKLIVNNRFLCRFNPWTYGKCGSLKARKHINGKMEIWAPRSNPEHALWIETHPDHWHKFKADQ